MSTTTPKPDRLAARIITPTNILHMPAEIIDHILKLFLLEGGSLVLFTHVNSLFREVALGQMMIWARISSSNCTDAGYDRIRTFLKRTGADCLLDIEFDFEFSHVRDSLDTVSHVKQLCQFRETFKTYFFRIERLTLSRGHYGARDGLTTAFLFEAIKSAPRLVHLDISNFGRLVASVDSPPAAMEKLESLVLFNDDLEMFRRTSMPTLKSLTIFESSFPQLFDFLYLYSTTLVDLTLDTDNGYKVEYESLDIWFPCLRNLSIRALAGCHWCNMFDVPVIEQVFVEFAGAHAPLALFQFLRRHSPSLKKISVQSKRTYNGRMLVDSINIEPFSFPALEQLAMSFPHMGFVLGQIRSAPALVNLEIGLGPDTVYLFHSYDSKHLIDAFAIFDSMCPAVQCRYTRHWHTSNLPIFNHNIYRRSYRLIAIYQHSRPRQPDYQR